MSSNPDKGAPVVTRPSGTVTFLMTDVEGSSKLWEEDPAAMKSAMARHHAIIKEGIGGFGGYQPLDQGEGDSIVGTFARPSDAIACALEVQTSLLFEPWPEGIDVRVRIALHSGEAELRDERNYAGTAINRCARLRSLAHGGQVLLSGATRQLTVDNLPDGAFLKDLGIHRLKDLAAPENIWELCHPSLPGEFPPLTSSESLPHNLPAQLTSFIGRGKEIGDIKSLVSAGRLTTLTGAAGCGKTRLATQVTADLLSEFHDGVWLVDLAPVSDPGLVTYSIASAMGLRTKFAGTVEGESPMDPPAPDEFAISSIRRVADHVRSRSILLVLDNCEHLIVACADSADVLLRECPNLRLLATSREPLGVAGEAIYRVPSLPAPDPSHLPPVDELGDFEAVRLFIDRARLKETAFSLSPDNARSVAEICQRLDGIPLAIELAAARVGSLTPRQIADRLGGVFRLLTGGVRTVLERQQTLRAAIDWSHQLLTDRERILLRRLSVFSGGFTLEAVEEVCTDGFDRTEILDLLTNLVDKSLVTTQDAVNQTSRYRLLETVRQYAREKLFDAGETEALRSAHRDFFLAMSERAEPEMEAAGLAFWLRTFDSELDNLRAALEWSLSDPQPGLALRMVSALELFWSLRGYRQEGRSWVDKALARDGDASPHDRAKALTAAWRLGPLGLEEGRRLVEEAMQASTSAGYERGILQSLLGKGQLKIYEGANDEAKSVIEEGLQLSRQFDDPIMESSFLQALGSVSYRLGEMDVSRKHMTEALTIARYTGSDLEIVSSLLRLARLLDGDAAYEDEERLLTEALSIARRNESTDTIVPLVIELSRLASYRGEDERARSLWEEATTLARESGELAWFNDLSLSAERTGDFAESRRWMHEAVTILRERKSAAVPLALVHEGWMVYLDGDSSAALWILEDALQAARADEREKLLLAESVWKVGEVTRALGDTAHARGLLEESLALAREVRLAPYALAGSLSSLAMIERAEGRLDEAGAKLREALTVQAPFRSPRLALSLERLAGVLVDAGDPGRAVKLFGAADAFAEKFHHRRPPVVVGDYVTDVGAARSALPPDEFAKMWSEGKSMTLNEAISFALDQRVTPTS